MDFEGNRQFAKYSSFKMAGEAEKYRLVLGAFAGGSAGECPPWAEGPGLQRRGDLLPVLALPRLWGERWRQPDVALHPPIREGNVTHASWCRRGPRDPFSTKSGRTGVLIYRHY